MSGYVRCPCCNQPIPVTVEDVGLGVTCPRTGRMVMVRGSDVQAKSASASKTPTAPAPKPPPAAPKPVAKPAAAPPRNTHTPPKRPVAPPPRSGRRRTTAGAAVIALAVLAVGGVVAVRAIRPAPQAAGGAETAGRVDEARPAESPRGGASPPPSPAGRVEPKPTDAPPARGPTEGDVVPALPVSPPVGTPGAVRPPAAPTLPDSLSQVAATYRREVVRVNHPRNCVMCHAPSIQQTDLVRGAVPDPSQPLPPPSTPAYYERGGQFVSADTTYLRQDFSVVQPVLDAGNWSSHQRFDYFVAIRKVDAATAAGPSPDSPYRKAAGFALRELSGRDPEREADWLAAQTRLALAPPDTRLAEIARLVSLQTDPKALIALKAQEFAQPLLSVPNDELNTVIKGLQEAYGVSAARTALVAYLEPLTRTNDPAARGKAGRLLAAVMSAVADTDLPERMRVAAAAPPVPDPVSPVAPAAPAPDRPAVPVRPATDARGLPIHALAKRIDTRKTDELEKELLGVREVSLDADGASTAADLVSLASTRKKNSQPYPGTAVACNGRPDLAGLPFRVGLDAALSKEKAEALHTLSKALRETVQGCIQRDDPRPNTDALYAALIPSDGRPGGRPDFRRHDPKKWTTAEAVPCIQQILAAENRDVRRLACELLMRIDTPDSTEALVRWAVFETDPSNRAAAVEALRTRTSHSVAQQLLAYVRYPWPRASEHAAEALVALNCKEVIPQLAVMYDLPDPDAPFRLGLAAGPVKAARPALDRLEALTAAAHLAKLRQVLAPLVKDLGAKEPEDRVKALFKIAAYGPDAGMVGEQVIEAMQDKAGAVQSAAATALEKINPKVHPHVVAILRGPKKREAILALGELGSEAAITVPLLLYCNDNSHFWGVTPKAGANYEDLFPVLAKIAPKDKRFADAVLGCVSAPNPNRYNTPRERRLAGIAQLKAIDVKPADKVAALIAALGDGEAAVQVIKALEEYGAAAKPALPALKKLKMAPDEAVRNAAVTAIAKIE